MLVYVVVDILDVGFWYLESGVYWRTGCNMSGEERHNVLRNGALMSRMKTLLDNRG